MMRSTFHGLETVKRSLFAQQTALHTTGHNIANANTQGYTRQRVDLTASRAMEAVGVMRSNTPGQLGTGVEFSSIERIREKFLDDQYRNENKSLGEWTIRRDTLEKIEAIMNEPSESGIRTVMDQFWSSWQDMSKDPNNLTARAVVKQRAIALAEAFNYTATKLTDLRNDLTQNININLGKANSTISQIGKLNEEIVKIEGLGDNANDLRDQRDVLVDELSKLVNVNVQETSNGTYTINVGSVTVVQGITSTPLELSNLDSGDISSGELYGMKLSRDQYVSDYSANLDAMVNGLVQGDFQMTLKKGMILPPDVTFPGASVDPTTRELLEDYNATIKGINGLHKLGYTLEEPATAGKDMFVSKDGGAITASTIALNPYIALDGNRFAASTRTERVEEGDPPVTVEKVIKGNGDLALAIAQLRNESVTFNSTSGTPVLSEGRMDDFFKGLIGQLGVQGQEAARIANNEDILTIQIDNRRQSVSGVSLDEEMSNMIKFQHAYNAAARAMTTMDEMLDKVINGMGVVGR
jgi:flagellar hook-associated protein 1 FlgK